MASAVKLESRGLASFQQAHGDLLEAARLQDEEALALRAAAYRQLDRADALREQAGVNTRRAESLGALLSLEA